MKIHDWNCEHRFFASPVEVQKMPASRAQEQVKICCVWGFLRIGCLEYVWEWWFQFEFLYWNRCIYIYYIVNIYQMYIFIYIYTHIYLLIFNWHRENRRHVHCTWLYVRQYLLSYLSFAGNIRLSLRMRLPTKKRSGVLYISGPCVCTMYNIV